MTEDLRTIRDLCRDWNIIEAKLNLNRLETPAETDDLMDAALERFQHIEPFHGIQVLVCRSMVSWANSWE